MIGGMSRVVLRLRLLGVGERGLRMRVFRLGCGGWFGVDRGLVMRWWGRRGFG